MAKKQRIVYRKTLKKVVDDYKRMSVCEYCGESDPVCLDFHHIDPDEKEFNIAMAGRSLSMTVAKLMREIRKCRVVCSNCHRKLHATEHARRKAERQLEKELEDQIFI